MRVTVSIWICLVVMALGGCYESRLFEAGAAADSGSNPPVPTLPPIPASLDLDGGCELACRRIAMCIGSPEIDECTRECGAQYTIEEIGCEEIVLQALTCIAEIDCEEGLELLGPCGDAINLAALQCSGDATNGSEPGTFF